jgi:hypothetical protein
MKCGINDAYLSLDRLWGEVREGVPEKTKRKANAPSHLHTKIRVMETCRILTSVDSEERIGTRVTTSLERKETQIQAVKD